jgi:hypothetical protein
MTPNELDLIDVVDRLSRRFMEMTLADQSRVIYVLASVLLADSHGELNGLFTATRRVVSDYARCTHN